VKGGKTMAMSSARGARALRRAGMARQGAQGAPLSPVASVAPRRGIAQTADQEHTTTPQGATLDGVVIARAVQWWRDRSPHTRRALVGALLALVAAVSAWGVTQAGLPPHATAHMASAPSTTSASSSLAHTSPVAPLGRLFVWLFGAGAYPTLALPLGLGALWMAEGAARRRLLRRWLAAPTLALWLLIELAARLLGGQAAGGALGDMLARPLAHAPLLLMQLLVLLLATLLSVVIGASLAHQVGSGLVALPGGALAALRRPRAARPSASPRARASDAHNAPARHLASDALDGPRSGADTEADDPAPAEHLQQSQPLVEAWVSGRPGGAEQVKGASRRAGGVGARGAAPRERPTPPYRAERPDPNDDVVAWAEALAQQTQQALLTQRAVAKVYPLRITATTIQLCVRPVERLKRDATGRIMTDTQGAPIIVRTRVSRILALRDGLARALGAPTLRLAPLAPEEAPDQDQPALVLEVPRLAN